MSTSSNSSNDSIRSLALPARGERALQTSPSDGAYYGYQAPFEDPDAETFKHYANILWRQKLKLFLCASLGAALAAGVTSFLPPTFRAKTVIEVQTLNEDFLDAKNLSPTALPPFQSPEFNVRTQATVLQSRPNLEKALEKSNLEARLLTKGPSRRLPGALMWKPVNKQELPPRELAVEALAAGLGVRTAPSTRVLELTFDSQDRQLATDAVNAVATSFIDLSLERRWQSSKAVSALLSRHLEELGIDLRRAEAELQQFTAGTNLTILAEKENPAEERLRQIQAEISKAQADRVMKQSRNELASRAPADSLAEVLDDPILKDLQLQLTGFKRQLAEMSTSLTPEHPSVEKAQAQAAALEAELQPKRANIVARIKSDYESAQRRENLLTSDYTIQLGFLTQQSDKVARYLTMKRKVDSTRLLYDELFRRVKEAGVASAMRANDISVIETAMPPRLPYKPNWPMNLAVGTFSGMLLGAVIALGRARANATIVQPGDLRDCLQAAELGVIPAFKQKRYWPGLPSGRKTRPATLAGGGQLLELTTLQDATSQMAESFRFTLASILLAERSAAQLRVIAITSAHQGEGKSTVICNLAVALARNKKRVLLIDGDLRKPRLHKVFDAENTVGFADLLERDADPVIQTTGIPGLFLLTSGRSANEQLMFSGKIRSSLSAFAREYDMVLVDTPPILQMTDARLLSHYADATILVVAQHTYRETAQLAKEYLMRDGSRLLGTILNNWTPQTSGRRSSWGYGYRTD